ncbi:MAG: hypothetical protein GXO34_02610 [Deltaproteobacteria bacterium]|nr:hypothetical protein [Deltaproteobacteria bacterium]
MKRDFFASFLSLTTMICLITGLSGCVATRTATTPQPAAGSQIAYIDGFDDGCRSGRALATNQAAGFKLDERRINTDPEYARGWADGFRQSESPAAAGQRKARIKARRRKWLSLKTKQGIARTSCLETVEIEAQSKKAEKKKKKKSGSVLDTLR